MKIIEFPFSRSWIFPNPDSRRQGDYPIMTGGDLNPERLLAAYAWGIFPWYSDGYPISWFSLIPRCIIEPENALFEKSLRSVIRNSMYRISFDSDFEQVIEQCGRIKRAGQRGTWITAELKSAFLALHDMNWAHSVEVWEGEELVGGLYGLAIGKVFFGESMFHKKSNASKIAFAYLIAFLKKNKYTMIDCQMESSLVTRFGAKMVGSNHFYSQLRENLWQESDNFSWKNVPVLSPLKV